MPPGAGESRDQLGCGTSRQGDPCGDRAVIGRKSPFVGCGVDSCLVHLEFLGAEDVVDLACGELFEAAKGANVFDVRVDDPIRVSEAMIFQPCDGRAWLLGVEVA